MNVNAQMNISIPIFMASLCECVSGSHEATSRVLWNLSCLRITTIAHLYGWEAALNHSPLPPGNHRSTLWFH